MATVKKDKSTAAFFAMHIGLALVVVAVLLLLVSVMLDVTTKHNKEISVPDFEGMSVPEASRVAKESGVTLDVVDSVYLNNKRRGGIVKQDPKAGAMVKKGRRIMLVVNSSVAQKLPMPNLVGVSMRSAIAELTARGFEVGKLIYVDDIATNNVLRQLYRGADIRPGQMIPSESKIDLELGLSYNDNSTVIPNVVGKKYKFAVANVHEFSLNVESVYFDKTVKTYQDSLNAVVFHQSPNPSRRSVIKGESVSLYLTLNAEAVENGAAEVQRYIEEMDAIMEEEGEFERDMTSPADSSFFEMTDPEQSFFD